MSQENSLAVHNSLWGACQSFYRRHERYVPAAFFMGGFLFDVVTLGRIDSWSSITSQSLYLFLLLMVLSQMMLETHRGSTWGSTWTWFTRWRVPILHFMFGSLLSAYTLFYFKSSSLASSFLFLFLLVGLLIANELPRFHKLGLSFKFALLSLCLMSFFAYLIPTLIGQTGKTIFVGSLIFGFFPVYVVFKWMLRTGVPKAVGEAQVLRPALLVLLTFVLCYLFRVIPPVPLSIQHIGIYHGVKKISSDQFELSFERPWWKIWHHGDQLFIAQPGDRVFVFFRLFSPTSFKDEVRVKWYLKEVKWGWVMQDEIPIKIVGGRELGFRGFAAKNNFTVGDWRVVVETSDGREIGRIGFQLEVVSKKPRLFQTEIQ